jgi:predicted nucleotidyltransferase
VKAFYFNHEIVLDKLKEISKEALNVFPEIIEVRLIGSFAKNEESGLSDIDLFIITKSSEKNPLERVRPYYMWFAEKIGISLDLIAATEQELRLSDNLRKMIENSILLS